MKLHSVLRRLFSVVAMVVALLTVYLFAIRPSQLHWGATAEEVARVMPGDGLVSHPTFCATRAITIRGRLEDTWPWIVQMGYGRAGFYGYDLIENFGSKRGIRSAGHIVPELQHPAVGDRVYMSSVAYLVFDSIVPDQFLIWRQDEVPSDGSFTWAVYRVDDQHIRLISRIRFRHHWTDWRIVLSLFAEFADHVAVPKVLAGIKDRVEGHSPEPLTAQAAEVAVWLLALFEFLVAIIQVFRWQRWWRAWVLAQANYQRLRGAGAASDGEDRRRATRWGRPASDGGDGPADHAQQGARPLLNYLVGAEKWYVRLSRLLPPSAIESLVTRHFRLTR